MTNSISSILESQSASTSARFFSLWQHLVMVDELFFMFRNFSWTCRIRDIMLLRKNSSSFSHRYFVVQLSPGIIQRKLASQVD